MTNHNVFPDPQATMGVLLRPPDGFEALYQGQARATPLPFVPVNYTQQGPKFTPLDIVAGSDNISEFFSRFIPAPIGADMLILIPRARYFTETAQEGTYTYELRWRLRSVMEHNTSLEKRGDAGMPYNIITQPGAPDDGTALTALPAWTSEVTEIAPQAAAALPVVSAPAQLGYAGQGIYVPDSVGGVAAAYAPNNFARLLRRVEGNELSIVTYRAAGGTTWDFAGDDAGISNVYGTNQGGDAHEIFLGVGMYLVFLAPAPAL